MAVLCLSIKSQSKDWNPAFLHALVDLTAWVIMPVNKYSKGNSMWQYDYNSYASTSKGNFIPEANSASVDVVEMS